MSGRREKEKRRKQGQEQSAEPVRGPGVASRLERDADGELRCAVSTEPLPEQALALVAERGATIPESDWTREIRETVLEMRSAIGSGTPIRKADGSWSVVSDPEFGGSFDNL